MTNDKMFRKAELLKFRFMVVNLYNQLGGKVGNVEIPNAIFNLEINLGLIHQAVIAQLANARKTLAHAKGRGEVRGGGRKPWRQKGTGRARHGSIRSPIWRGGGVTHGPTKEKIYAKKINKQAKKKALFMALSSKVKDGQIMIIDAISLNQPKTKAMKNILDNISKNLPDYRKTKKKQDSFLVVYPHTKRTHPPDGGEIAGARSGVGVKPDSDENLIKAVRNLEFAKAVRADSLNVMDILENKYLVLLKEAIPVIEKTYLK